MTWNAGSDSVRWQLSRLVLLLALTAAPVRSAPVGEMLVDLNRSYYTLGSHPAYLGTVGGKAILRTWGEPNAFVWITDGTPEGTQALEIWTRGNVDSPELLALGTAGSHFFLLERYQGPGNDAILAIDDQGTVTRVIESGDTWEFLYFGAPRHFRVAGRKLALTLTNLSGQPSELVFIDGDTLETEIALTSATGSIELLGAIGDDLVFSRTDYEAELATLWRSRGTAATTAQFATVAGQIDADRAAAGDSVVYFSARGPGESGVEVWATDRTAAGTVALTALPDPSALIGAFHLDGDRAYFVVTDASIGQELFATDGRPSATRAVTSFGFHQPFGYGDGRIAIASHRAFFVATDGIGAFRLWLAGDRPETTRSLVENVQFDSSSQWIAAAGGSVFVPTIDDLGAVQLVVSDGSEAGTHEVETGCSDPCFLYPQALATTASTFYFTARSPAAIQETLYATRPPFHLATPLFAALKEGPILESSTDRSVAIVGEKVYFAAGQYVGGYSVGAEPWVTWGTPATTSMIRRLAAFESSSAPRRFRTTGGALAFSTDNGHPSLAWRRPAVDAAVEEVPGDYEICYYGSDIYPLTGRFILRDCDDDFWSFQASGGAATRLTAFGFDSYPRSVGNGQIVGLLRWNGSSSEAWRVGDPEGGATLARALSDEEANGELVVAGSRFVLIRDLDPAEQLFGLGTDLTAYEAISPAFSEVDHYIGPPELGRGFFAADENGGEVLIWTTDGTAAGTRALFPPEGYSQPVDAIRSASVWIVLASVYLSESSELQVWRTDGSPAGSTLLAAVPLEADGAGARLAGLPGWYLFSRRTPDNGSDLWAVPAAGGTPTALLPADVRLRGASPPMSVVSDLLFFTACDVEHGCELWVSAGTPETTRLFQDIRPGAASSTPDQLLTVGNELVFTADDGLHGVEPWHVIVDGGATCREGHGAVCLDDSRFLVRAAWKAPVSAIGDAGELPLTPDTGAFWFFDPENIELIVKAIDGSGTNGHEWVFYGALSNVEYSLDVTDSWTGAAKRYFNPAGRFASAGDILAFPSASPVAALSALSADTGAPPHDAPSAFVPSGTCAATASRFCILGGRFAVEATWRDFQGRTGTARAGSLTDDTGFFWFFDEANVEIVVKAIDGSAYNDGFWIYYGALSNVEYTIRVTDTVTLAVREYRNALGAFGSFGDITAFPAD